MFLHILNDSIAAIKMHPHTYILFLQFIVFLVSTLGWISGGNQRFSKRQESGGFYATRDVWRGSQFTEMQLSEFTSKSGGFFSPNQNNKPYPHDRYKIVNGAVRNEGYVVRFKVLRNATFTIHYYSVSEIRKQENITHVLIKDIKT